MTKTATLEDIQKINIEERILVIPDKDAPIEGRLLLTIN